MTKNSFFHLPISCPDFEFYEKAKKNWDAVAKPIDGLGDFEDLICRIAAMQETTHPILNQKTLVVFCSDNGVVEEGVSQCGPEVTAQVACNLGQGTSSACCLAKSVGADVLPVDVGICGDVTFPGVKNRRIKSGTENFLKAPAMTERELLRALEIGIETVFELADKGVNLIATGEMGIGNTTTATACLCATLGIDSETVTGRGAGLDDDGLRRKKEVISEGIRKYSSRFVAASTESERCFEILRCLGGFDIAALCGTYIGCAVYKIPVVIDGVISATAALMAERIVPGAKNYMIASHSGREKGNERILRELGLKHVIEGNMALGEGTGALMVLPLLDAALYFYNNGLRFADSEIDSYERFV